MKKWKKIPESEFERLDKTLDNHLRKMKVKLSKDQRMMKIKKILKDRNSLVPLLMVIVRIAGMLQKTVIYHI